MYTIELNTMREAMNQLKEKVKQLDENIDHELYNSDLDDDTVFCKLEDLNNAVQDMIMGLEDFESGLYEAEDANEKLCG